MKRNISDLLDQYPAEDLEFGKNPYSPSRIKELTMKQIDTSKVKTVRFKPARLLIAAAVAAALSVTALAASRFFGAGEQFQDFFVQDSGALSQGQMDTIDQLGLVFSGEGGAAPAAVTNNGATITPIAAIADENVYYLRLRVEAPEGTALPDLDGDHYYQFWGKDYETERLVLEAADGTVFGYNINRTVLPDDEPNDNRKEFVLCLTRGYGDKSGVKFNDGASKILTIHGLWVQDIYKNYTPIFAGEFQFDIGLNFQSQTIDLDAKGVAWTDEVLQYTNTLEYLTLSPLSLSYCYHTTLPDNEYFGPAVSITIALKDGTMFIPGDDTTQETIDYLRGWHNLEVEDILPLPGEPGPDTEGYFAFNEPLDLSQVDYVLFGDVKIPVSME